MNSRQRWTLLGVVILGLSGWAGLGLRSETVPAARAAPASFRLRVVAANLSSGRMQSYDPGHGIRILDGLDPDVALMQEFQYGTNRPQDLRKLVDAAFGPDFVYYVEPRRGPGAIPNGVVSRWPIVESGIWDDPAVDNREFAWVRIDLPGSRDLWAVSVHFLTRDGRRPGEAKALVAYLREHVPEDDYLVVGGDFNTDRAGEQTLEILGKVVSVTGRPVDQAGNPNTNASRRKPYDWVLPDAQLVAAQVPVRIGTQTFEAGLVFDSRVYTPLSDVAPVRSEDSAAFQMQHMAVVKDFELSE